MISKRVALYSMVFSLLVLSACQKDKMVASYDYKTLGTSAHDLLSASTFTAMKIEIEYMPGYAADTGSISNMITFLNRYLNKPGGIPVFQRQIGGSSKTSLSINEIDSIEKTNRTIFTGASTIAVHVLITDGFYSNPQTLGTSYWNTSACIFGPRYV